MGEINFAQIAPRCGGQREAFEEICCQLARFSVPTDARFIRLRGDGGDGGVECYADMSDGSRVGWQAKFVFNVDTFLVQVTASLKTALAIHARLTKYIVCFPFDLTGPTSRKCKSGIEKFDAWRAKWVRDARKKGRQLVIEEWPESKLRTELLRIDPHGGIRAFFFNSMVLSGTWFENHLSIATAAAGPRYTPS